MNAVRVLWFLCVVSFGLCDWKWDQCTSHSSSCGECIQIPNCFWDLERDSTVDSRCRNLSVNFNNKNIFHLHNSIEIIESTPVNELVHFAPQHVKINLRPKTSFTFSITTQTSTNFTIKGQNRYTKVQFTPGNSSKEVLTKIEAVECPKDPTMYHSTITIRAPNTNQSVVVEVDLICACPCEKQAIPEAPQCSGRGTYKCSICECPKGYFGRYCECQGITSNNCIAPNSTAVCSDRGNCVCGLCECEIRPNSEENIFGVYCECDNYSCDRFEGKLCGGHDRGTCECGRCQCKNGWKGSNCGISTSE